MSTPGGGYVGPGGTPGSGSIQSQPLAPPTGASSAAPAFQGDPSLPRGLRNNNPLNLSYVQGQPGVIGRMAARAIPRRGHGHRCRGQSVQIYQDRDGLTTPRQIITKWAPGSNGNNPNAYAQSVAQASGLNPDQPINMRDPVQAAKLIHRMPLVENGRAVDPAAINAGVAMAMAGPQRRISPGAWWRRSVTCARPAPGGSIVSRFPASPSGGRLSECLAFLREGDALVVTKPDRLARSTAELLKIEADLSKRGVGLVVLSMGGERLDTGNPPAS